MKTTARAGFGLAPPHRGRVTVPAVAFAGRTDYVLGPAVFERARRFHDSSYEVVVMPGGHVLHREDPQAFNTALLAWLPV